MEKSGSARMGFWAAVATALFAAMALGIGVTTPPRSGPFAAPGTALAYPYAGASSFVPRDFLWMYAALLMVLAFFVLAACIHSRASDDRKLSSTLGLHFAGMSVTVLAIGYFIQLQTVQPGLLAHEAESIVALSQYNPHGVFIALENLGFLAMSISFLFLAFSLGGSRLERVARRVLLISALAAFALFLGLWLYLGFGLGYTFEVWVILLNWLTLIVSGVLFALLFRTSAAV